ncbi:MAG: macro domain-containing protein [Victivallales bacterium]|nr:macro domain-containing protein [Victivallales bacterium]
MAEVCPGVCCPTDEARITPGFKLPAKFVIHTVGPVYRNGKHGESKKLAACYRNSLAIALENNCKFIAFPCISTGVYGYPIAAAAQITVRTINTFFAIHPDLEIFICCVSDRNNMVYEVFFEEIDTVREKALYPLRLQASDWHDLDTIGACICQMTACEDNQQIRFADWDLYLPLIGLAYQRADFQKMGCALLYFTAPQLELHQRISPSIKMQDAISFQITAVMISHFVKFLCPIGVFDNFQSVFLTIFNRCF